MDRFSVGAVCPQCLWHEPRQSGCVQLNIVPHNILFIGVQAWEATELGMSMCLSNQTLISTYTTAVFINVELAAACGLQPGSQFSLKKSADADSGSAARMPVYSHPAVPQGHVCMASTTMQQLALPELSQVRAPTLFCVSSRLTTHLLAPSPHLSP
jgi:hypothetical protein